jgi:hypothetical protein
VDQVDCDDLVSTTNPFSPDICGDGVDNDCDGNGDFGTPGAGGFLDDNVLTYAVRIYDVDGALADCVAFGFNPSAVAAGTLLFIDNAVAAEGRMLRVEAAQIMAAALPPAPAPGDNAAPLYQRAFESLAADKTIREEHSPAADPLTADPASPEVAAILARHSAALDLLRRAADKSVTYVPRRLDDQGGIGTQLVTADINADGRPDFISGNKRGTAVLLSTKP